MNAPDFFTLIAEDPNIDPALRAFFSKSPITVRGSDRQREVMAEEHADHQREERRADLERGL